MKRILAMLLAVLMLVPVLAACTDDTPDTPDTTPSSDSKVEDTTVPEETGLTLDKTDFGGTNLRILGVSEDYNFGYYQTGDIWIETEQADPFERSVYIRLQDCINKYNFGVGGQICGAFTVVGKAYGFCKTYGLTQGNA